MKMTTEPPTTRKFWCLPIVDTSRQYESAVAVARSGSKVEFHIHGNTARCPELYVVDWGTEKDRQGKDIVTLLAASKEHCWKYKGKKKAQDLVQD